MMKIKKSGWGLRSSGPFGRCELPRAPVTLWCIRNSPGLRISDARKPSPFLETQKTPNEIQKPESLLWGKAISNPGPSLHNTSPMRAGEAWVLGLPGFEDVKSPWGVDAQDASAPVGPGRTLMDSEAFQMGASKGLGGFMAHSQVGMFARKKQNNPSEGLY